MTLDEELRAIILDPNMEPQETIQAIKEVFCKHRGCETSNIREEPYAMVYVPPGRFCIWCKREYTR